MVVISLGGYTVVTYKCPHCFGGKFVEDPTGRLLGHYRRSSVYRRSGVAFETSALCPGEGRAYRSVAAPYRSQAIIKAIRLIISSR